MRRAATWLALVAALALVNTKAVALEKSVDSDQNLQFHYMRNLPAPGSDGTRPAREQDVAPGACIPKSPGANTLPFICSVPETDYVTPAFTLGGQLGGTPASATVLGLRETGGPTLIPYGAIPSNSFLFNNGSTIVGTTTVPTTAIAGLTATWAIAGERVYCVDAASGNDANLGYADSADQTLANVGAATATCGTVAKQTWAAMVAAVPPSGLGRTVGIIPASGTYTDSLGLLDRLKGYALITMRGTATNSTASSVKFAGDANDILFNGATTAAGANAAGYNPTSSTTSDTITLALVGGGSPSFGAEPAMPVGYRVRFDSATFTSGRRNQVFTVVERVNATTVRLNSSIAFNTSDVLYIEQPGVVFSDSATPTFATAGNNQVRLSGAVISSITQNSGTMSLNFVHSAGLAFSAAGASQTFGVTGTGFGSTTTVGPNRFGSVSATAASVSIAPAALATTTSVTFTSCPNYSVSDRTVVGTDVVVIGGGDGVSNGFGAVNSIGGTGNVGDAANLSTAVRVLGKIDLRGARVTFKTLNLPSTTQAYGIGIFGTNDVSFTSGVYGGTKTNAGIDASKSTGSRITVVSPFFSGTESPELTGTNGDWFGGNEVTANVPIYVSWAGLAQNYGTVILPSGDIIVTSVGPAFSTRYSANYGMAYAMAVYNHTGSDFGTTSDGRGLLAGLNSPSNDSQDLNHLKADTLAHATGGIVELLGGIKAGNAGYAIPHGNILACYSDGPSECLQPGGTSGPVPVYLSEVEGKVRVTPPASPNVTRQIGWSSGETSVILQADSHPGMPYFATGIQPTALGYVKVNAINTLGLTTAATVPWGDLTGVPSFYYQTIASAGSSLTQRPTFNFSALLAATDNSGSNRTDVTLANTAVSAGSYTYGSFTVDAQGRLTAASSGATPAVATRTLTAGAGMTGGGDLSADRTFDVVANADGTIVVNANDVQAGVMQTANIAANAVTLPKIVNFITDSFPCRDTAGTGNLEVCAVGGGIEFTGGPGIQSSAYTGDVTKALGGTVLTIAGHAVSYAKIQQAGAQTLLGNPTGSTANVSEITLGAGLSFSGTTLVATGSGGITQLTGDGTAGPGSGSQVFTLSNIPTGTAMAGYLAATAIAAPGTPGAGIGRIYVDSTSKNLAVKDDAGVVKHGVQTRTAVSHQFVTAISDAGVASLAQPDYSDISGTPLDLSGMHFITTQAESSLSAETSLGALSSGLLYHSVSSSISTPAALNGTTGSVVFFSSTGVPAQDNANFFWDGTNHSLGLGGAPPSTDRFFVSGRARLDSTVNVTGVPTDADHAGLFLNANTSDAQLSFGRDGTMTGSIMGKASTLAYFAPAAGTKDHTFYFDASIGAARFYASMTPGATNPVVSIGPSGIDVAALSAGGIAKAAATTGRLAIASASDIATALSMPSGSRILAGNGTGFLSSDEFRLDPSDIVLVGNSGAIAWRNGTAAISQTNYDQVRGFFSGNVFNLKSEKAGTGTVRAMKIDANTADLTLAGVNVNVFPGTGSFAVSTPGNAIFAVDDARGGPYWIQGDGGAGQGLVSTSSTTGFLYIPETGGTPTGTPANLAARPGAVPVVYDRINDILYVWNDNSSTWRAH